MDEYVKRGSALESLCIACEVVPIDEKENCPYRFTGCQEYANIFVLPAADVVEVVRCRECIRADKYGHCEMQNFWGTRDDFCSRGNRRKDA